MDWDAAASLPWHAPRHAGEFQPPPGSGAFLADAHFRFAALDATLRTNDPEFKARFRAIFADCEQASPPMADASTGLQPLLQVVSSPSNPFVCATILPERDFDPGALAAVDPELMAMGDTPDASRFAFARAQDATRQVLEVRANQWRFDRRAPWQAIIAHYFVHHVMGLQRGLFFFHGATLAMGPQGVLLSGPKGAGKSTLSMALASRGHGFLGDEVAAVDSGSGGLHPFPRSVSLRHGPQAASVRDYLGAHRVDRETLPDGTERMRMPVSRIFPASLPRLVPLTHAFFLDQLADQPRATPITFSLGHLPLLAPLYATVRGMPTGERTIKMLRLFNRIRCFMLTPGGTPDQTAELIENILGNPWGTPFKRKPSALAPSAG